MEGHGKGRGGAAARWSAARGRGAARAGGQGLWRVPACVRDGNQFIADVRVVGRRLTRGRTNRRPGSDDGPGFPNQRW